MVFIPYCTGDVFAGDRRDVDVSRSVRSQQFVGYSNMTRFLEHIAPTFSDADQVLLTGFSAGGFGALLNYDQTKEIFGDTPVYMVDDSGIPLQTRISPLAYKISGVSWEFNFLKSVRVANRRMAVVFIVMLSTSWKSILTIS